MSKLSKEPYKGVRDFYPKDMFIQKYMFGIMRKVVEEFGYDEYNSSVLEHADLYRAKSGEEIINDQTYTFIDRGEREVTLRPEMTPTIARMIASQWREIPFPARWYSIPNLFRYERPQRGRLREHWQLNVDMFGTDSIFADIEMLHISHTLLREFGLHDDQFSIHINNRALVNMIFNEVLETDEDLSHRLGKLLDRKTKMAKEEFDSEVDLLLDDKASLFKKIIESKNLAGLQAILPESAQSHTSLIETQSVINELSKLGIHNATFDITIMRGFDYYTGIVFEIFDTHPDNNRSLFGGGRYDNLLEIFGEQQVPAVGFGMGDVMLRDVLETYDLLPEYNPSAEVVLCTLSSAGIQKATALAEEFRAHGINTAVDFTLRKTGAQISNADKLGARYIVCIGEDEVSSNTYTLKELSSGHETEGDSQTLITIINSK